MGFANGCAHNVIYNENRDKQGQEVKKAVAEARLVDTVTSLEKTFAELATLEETSARDRATYLFDLELKTLSKASSLDSEFDTKTGHLSGLQTIIKARLKELGRSPGNLDDLTEVKIARVKIKARKAALESTLSEFRGTVGFQFQSCEMIYAASVDPKQKKEEPSAQFLANIPANKKELARTKFPALISDCKKLGEAEAEGLKLVDGGSGQIEALKSELKSIDDEILAYDVAKEAAKKALKAATENAAKILAAANKSSPSKLKLLEQQADLLRKALEEVRKSNLVGQQAIAQAVAEDKLESLETVLGAIAGSPGEGKVTLTGKQQAAVAAIRDLPALADEANKLLLDATKPRLVPFLAAIDYQRILVRSFDEVVLAKRKQANAVRKQLDAARNEAAALLSVLSLLHDDWAKKSVTQLEATLPSKDKKQFYLALATYADEVQQYRVEMEVWRARALVAQYEAGLVQSKFAAAEWDKLLETMAAVLADYEAAGIKNADLAEFLKAAGLFAIAIGIGVAQ